MSIHLNKKYRVLNPLVTRCCPDPIVSGEIVIPFFEKDGYVKTIDKNNIGHNVEIEQFINNTLLVEE